MALEDTRPLVNVRLELVNADINPQLVAARAVARLYDAARYLNHAEPNLDSVRLSLQTTGVPGRYTYAVVATARCGALIADGEPACPSCHAHGDQPHTDYCQRNDLTASLRTAIKASQEARIYATTLNLDAEETELVETALRAVDGGDAGHWPTVAGWLAVEVRRLRAILDQAKPE